MKTITQTVYKFSELSDKAKARAKDDYASAFGYAFANEALGSLSALAEHFGGKLVDYEIHWDGTSYSKAKFDMHGASESEIEQGLASLGTFNALTLKGNGDCKLTGYCSDEDAIDGIRKAWHGGERDIDRLMVSAFRSWLKACQSDCRSQYEDENFSEMSEANDYWYFESGELAPTC